MERSSRRRVLAVGATAMTTAVAGCMAGGDGASEQRVEMTNDLAFAPDAVTVTAGTTVTWENTGTVGHTVTAYEDELPDGASYFGSGDFESENAARQNPGIATIGEGETFEHTLEVPGEYEYFCIPHESSGMTGTITVE